MSKAILVIDMPESCSSCPINFWNRCNVLEAQKKLSGWIENPSRERLKNCPLRPLPEKYDIEEEKKEAPRQRLYLGI